MPVPRTPAEGTKAPSLGCELSAVASTISGPSCCVCARCGSWHPTLANCHSVVRQGISYLLCITNPPETWHVKQQFLWGGDLRGAQLGFRLWDSGGRRHLKARWAGGAWWPSHVAVGPCWLGAGGLCFVPPRTTGAASRRGRRLPTERAIRGGSRDVFHALGALISLASRGTHR